jgi:hypothetical protein
MFMRIALPILITTSAVVVLAILEVALVAWIWRRELRATRRAREARGAVPMPMDWRFRGRDE